MVAAELYIIDGDNVCHLRGGSDDYQRAREQLVAEVAGYMAQLGIDAFVVLDGHGRSRSIGRTQLTYSGRETADTVIERLAFRQRRPRGDGRLVRCGPAPRRPARRRPGDERAGVHRPSGGRSEGTDRRTADVA